MDACVARYPDRFAGALTFDYMADDLEEQVKTYRDRPGMLAGRNLVGNANTAELRPEYGEGKFDRLWAYAEKYNLPLFFSTHGWAHVMEPVAQKHPGLTMVIDHLGVSQSPVSPARAEPWDRLDGLLGLAKYPNVHVKFSGVPLMSKQGYPYTDTWPYLHKIIDAFTPDRLFWGTDFTRMRWIPQTSSQLAPRDQWKNYCDCVNYLRDTNEISASDKEKIFGGSIRRALRWPKPKA
jgi:predicted TIM-barrel fold metal-dependent hydrolase